MAWTFALETVILIDMDTQARQRTAQEVADFYESQGQMFSSKRGRSWNLMDLIVQKVKPGDTLIDMGAGNGRLFDVLPANINYLGVEPSEALRQQAEARNGGHPNFKIISGSLPRVDLPDQCADLVACVAVLHHVPSQAWRHQAIQEMHRLLKPGGWLVCAVWNLRARRFFSWPTFKYAWLRAVGVPGGDGGDLYYAWKAGSKPEKRYVHAYTLAEYKNDFDPELWSLENIGAYDLSGWCHWFKGRNLVAVVRKK